VLKSGSFGGGFGGEKFFAVFDEAFLPGGGQGGSVRETEEIGSDAFGVRACPFRGTPGGILGATSF
jgi:hypothetical protein